MGRLFVAPVDGGVVTGYNVGKHVSGVAVDVGANLYAVTQDASQFGTLRKFDQSGAPTAVAASSVTMTFPSSTVPGSTTPVLGAGGIVYAVGSNGAVLAAAQTNLTQRWARPLDASITGAVQASATLDCNRQHPSSGTGVLYFATNAGWLVAYIVDSPGLDSTAQWAKYQHDARNTGNSAVPVDCP